MKGDEVGRGVRSTVYAYGPADAAKVPNPDVPAAWLTEELRLTDLAAMAGAPTPARRRLVDIDGHPALVQAHVAGLTMTDELAARPQRAGALGVELAAIQAALATLVPSVAMPAQRDRVAAKVHAAARDHGADLVRALDLVPADDQPLVLCHGDLHPGNVIRSEAGNVLVDWFDASRGTMAGEIARTVIMLRASARSRGGRLGLAFDELAEGYLDAACDGADVDADDLADWETVQLIARVAEGFGVAELPALRDRLCERLSRP